jgi:hypothetical protein
VIVIKEPEKKENQVFDHEIKELFAVIIIDLKRMRKIVGYLL